MGFWDDVEKATQQALSTIRDSGGLDGLIFDTLGDPSYVAPVNTGNSQFHAVEAVNHAQWSLHHTNQEAQANMEAVEHWDNMETELDNAWDALKNGSISGLGGALKNAFSEAGGSFMDHMQAREHGVEASRSARLAGDNADMAGNQYQNYINQSLGPLTVTGVPNLTSFSLTNQMAGMSSVGEWIETSLNRVNSDINTKIAPIGGWMG